MSDIEDDLEFYKAVEDELYRDFDESNDEIDSDIEAEVYQSVHFASSLVQTSNKEGGIRGEASGPEQQDIVKAEDIILGGKESLTDQADGKNDVFFLDKQGDLENSNEYPEMKSVFSDGKKPKTISSKVFSLNIHNTECDPEQENASGNNWDIDHADKAINQANVKKPRKAYVRCFNCNERGHRTFECNKEKKDQVCYLCGKTGHIRQRCPDDVCFNCQEPGHQMKNCKKSRCHPRDSCNRCHAFGHHEHSCPDKWRQYHITTSPGEIVSPIQRYQKSVDGIYCYNCGEKGHMGHECWKQGDKGGYFCTAFPFVVKYDNGTQVSNPLSTPNFRAPLKTNQNSDKTPKNKASTQVSKSPETQGAPLSKKRKKARKKEQLGNAETQPKKKLKLDENSAKKSGVQHLQGNSKRKQKKRRVEEWVQDPCDMLKQQVRDGRTVFWGDSNLAENPIGTSENTCGKNKSNNTAVNGTESKTVTVTNNALQITFTNEKDKAELNNSTKVTPKKKRKKKKTLQIPGVPEAQSAEKVPEKPKRKRKRKKSKTIDLTNCQPDMPILGLNAMVENGPTFPANKINKPKVKKMNAKKARKQSTRLKIGFV